MNGRAILFYLNRHDYIKFFGAHLAHKNTKKRTNIFKVTKDATIKNRIKPTISESGANLQMGNLATHNPKVVGSNPASARKTPKVYAFGVLHF